MRATGLAATLAATAVVMWAGCGDDPQQPLTLPTPGSGTSSSSTANGGGGSGGAGGGATTSTGTTMYNSAQEAFELGVWPYIDPALGAEQAECSVCHGPTGIGEPTWVQGSASETYASITAEPLIPLTPADCSKLLIYTGSDAHTGPAPSPDLQAAFATWLEMEAAERGLPACETPDPGGPSPLEQCNAALEAFQGCMYLGHWEATGMGELPKQPTSLVTCEGCHANSAGGVKLSNNIQATFDAHALDVFILQKLVTCSYDLDTSEYLGLVVAQRYPSKGQEGCVGEPCHPSYLLSPQRLESINTFVSEVNLAIENDTCADLALIQPLP